jgi:hypothetical protein
MKQRSLVFGKSENYSVCSKKIREHLDSCKKKPQDICDKKSMQCLSNFYPVAFFVKEAIRTLSHQDNDDEKHILNKQWEMFSNTIPKKHFNNVLTIIDASYYMQLNDYESFYTAIGFAILIAERSSFGKRILLADYQSTWINFDEETEFTSIIENIHNSIKSTTNTLFNIDSVMELIVYSLIQSKSNNQYIENMKLVLLSDFHGIDSMELFTKMFSKYGLCLPNFIFWNLAKQEVIPIFFHTTKDIKSFIISGISNGGIRVLYDLLKYIKQTKGGSIYDYVSFILNNKRYDILEDYCL